MDPGFSAQMIPETLQNYLFPEGLAWVADEQAAPVSAVRADPLSRPPL
jgi:hypothetical protein